MRWWRFWCEMAALSSKAVQEQISAIMGALTTAAVAEICALLDEGYSALRLEISRSRRENQDLRRKLHLIESIVVRGGSGAAGPQAADPELGAPAAEVKKVPPRRFCLDLRRAGGSTRRAAIIMGWFKLCGRFLILLL